MANRQQRSGSPANRPAPNARGGKADGNAPVAAKAEPKPTATSRREQLRLQQEAQAKRDRTMRMIVAGGVVLAVAIVAMVVIYLVNRAQTAKRQQGTTGSATQIAPPNALADKSGIVVNPGKAIQGAPTLGVHSDYQCPACAAYDERFGASITALADKGEINLVYHTRSFLDISHKNDSSTRAGIAAACSDTVGALAKYHQSVMANQGDNGYTEEQLRSTFAAEAGITGDNLTKFQSCYDGRATSDFVKGMETKGTAANVNSTPTYLVNGKTFELRTVNPTEADILAAIKAAV